MYLLKFETKIVQFKATSFSLQFELLTNLLNDLLHSSFCYVSNFTVVKYNSKISIIICRQIKTSGRYNEQVFYKKPVLKNFAIFTEKQSYWNLFLNKTASLQPWNFIKKMLRHRFFSCEYCKIFKKICFGEHLRKALWTFSYMSK